MKIDLGNFDRAEVVTWLRQALGGLQALPKLTPDEAAYLGVLRVEKDGNSRTSDFIRLGALELLIDLCRGEEVKTNYAQELLALISSYKQPEAVRLLAETAQNFPKLSFTEPVQFAILSTLVDTPPPQSAIFWRAIFNQNPARHSALVLSGLLETYPREAVNLLPLMPNDEMTGASAALKLDLTWDNLPVKKRFLFTQDVGEILNQCGDDFKKPVHEWLISKEIPVLLESQLYSLSNALQSFLGSSAPAKRRTPKLVSLEVYSC